MTILSLIRFLFLLLMSTLSLWAYSDSDFDGVGDSKDICPNTSFDQVVDHYGCPERKDITLMLGEEFSSGKYGGTDTVTTTRSSLFASFTTNTWSYALSTSTVKTQTSTTKLSGTGDVYATISYNGLKSKKRLTSFQAGMKMATADTSIGTGENDYNIRISNVILDKAYSYLSSIGYTVTGDTNLQTYNDYVNVSAGLGYQRTKKLYLSASMNYASAYIQNADASLDALVYLAYIFTEKWFMTASSSLGLSDAVADFSANMSLGVKF